MSRGSRAGALASFVLDRRAMRLVVIALALAACTDSYRGLSLDPSPARAPLGVGLAQRYEVTQELCEGGVDGGCGNPVSPTQLAVSGSGGIAVSAVTPYDGRAASFVMTGTGEGSATVAVTGYDDITTTFPIAVATVASTQLVAPRVVDTNLGEAFSEVLAPIHAFVGSNITVAQHNFGAGQAPLAGSAPLALDAGTTAVTYDASCDCYHTGTTTGIAQLTAPLGAGELVVVDTSAIADFTLEDLGSAIQLVVSPATVELFLLPHDASGFPIVGRGPEPAIAIADPSLVALYREGDNDAMRSVVLIAHAAGTTTLDIAWGDIHNSFTLQIVP
jgi:hypothetical protein